MWQVYCPQSGDEFCVTHLPLLGGGVPRAKSVFLTHPQYMRSNSNTLRSRITEFGEMTNVVADKCYTTLILI